MQGFRPALPEPDWWTFTCDAVRPVGRHFSATSNNSQGTSLDESEALKRALGEAIERYVCANSFDPDHTHSLTAAQSPVVAQLARCALDEDCSESYKTISPQAQLTHSLMSSLSNQTSVPVPSGYVHLSFVAPDKEPKITTPNSSGCAFHTELPKAILGGLCELAERDAAMGFWWNRKIAARLVLNQCILPFALTDRISRIEHSGIRVKLFDISTDFPMPIILCVLSGPHYPYQSFGTACDTDLGTSCIKAIDQAIAVRFKQIKNTTKAKILSREHFDWVHDLEDQAELYASWKNCPALEFFMESDSEIFYSQMEERTWWQPGGELDDLSTLSRQLESNGLTVLWSDITTDDARQFGHCVRVVVPQLIPLSVQHSIRWLGAQRLYSGMYSKETGVPSAKHFNPFPHPFA